MEKRSIGGLVLGIIGFVLTLFGIFSNSDDRVVLFIYGGLILLIGIIIFFNKGEDKIEEINEKEGIKDGKK